MIGCILGCGRCALHRGLCKTHYQKAVLSVSRGQTTWAKLIAAGQAQAVKERRPFWFGR